MSVLPSRRRAVTVIVPVYDDLPGLERCIRALCDTVDFSTDRVVLANDAGPHADQIEQRITDIVGGHPGFRYTRNDRNLGFVGNCNRAVRESENDGNDILLLNSDTVPSPGFIDEMAEVLATDSGIGIVCARSDNATIATFPYARRNPGGRLSAHRVRSLHTALRPILPRVSPSPVAMGFCFLVRRTVIDRFGLFEPIFAPGYGEENDLCLRINEHGFASVFANHALVLHTGSTSFNGDRGPALRLSHERILLDRYPYYAGAVMLFLCRYRDAVDAFADAFLPDDDLIRVGLHLPSRLDRAAAFRVQTVLDQAPDDMVVTLIVPRDRVRTARRLFPTARMSTAENARRIFDVAIAADTVCSFDELIALNRSAPRWVLVGSATKELRWSDAVRQHRAEAISRIVRRFENQNVVWTDADSLLHVVTDVARTAIDTKALRERWTTVSDIAEATGWVVHASKTSVRRRTALMLGARFPRFIAWCRGIGLINRPSA